MGACVSEQSSKGGGKSPPGIEGKNGANVKTKVPLAELAKKPSTIVLNKSMGEEAIEKAIKT